MEKHPMAGKPIKVTGGRYKGSIFTPIDFLVNQFQGKKIENIKKGHANLFFLIPAEEQNDQLVFGELYGVDKENNRVVIHNKHLIKEVKDATTGPSKQDHKTDEPGGSEPDGRSVSGGEVHGENVLPLKQSEEADRPAGSGDSGPEAEHPRSSEPQVGAAEPVKDGEVVKIGSKRRDGRGSNSKDNR